MGSNFPLRVHAPAVINEKLAKFYTPLQTRRDTGRRKRVVSRLTWHISALGRLKNHSLAQVC